MTLPAPKSSLILAYYPTAEAYAEAVAKHTAHIKDASDIRVRFSQTHRGIWHRGELLYWQAQLSAWATYTTADGSIRTQRISAKGWSLYSMDWQATNRIEVTNLGSGSRYEVLTKPEICSCPAFLFAPGERRTCKHRQMLGAELNKAPWLSRPIYAYPAPVATPTPAPAPAPAPLPAPAPQNCSTLQKVEELKTLTPCDIKPGLWTEENWDITSTSSLRVLCRVEGQRLSEKPSDHCIGRISLEYGWLVAYNHKDRELNRVVPTEQNVRILALNIFNKSSFSDRTLIARVQIQVKTVIVEHPEYMAGGYYLYEQVNNDKANRKPAGSELTREEMYSRVTEFLKAGYLGKAISPDGEVFKIELRNGRPAFLKEAIA